MGWQHYSRRLWLSRGNHYILYLNAITAQMRVCGLVFHKWDGFIGIAARFLIRYEGGWRRHFCGAWISSLTLTQDLRPGLSSVAPSGLVLRVARRGHPGYVSFGWARRRSSICLRCGHVAWRDAALRRLQRSRGLDRRHPIFASRTHRDVNVFKDQPRSDALSAIGWLDQIVAGLAAVLPSECVDEEERLSELSGFDEEARAIDFPGGTSFSHVHLPFGGRENEKAFSLPISLATLSSSASLPEASLVCWLKCV